MIDINNRQHIPTRAPGKDATGNENSNKPCASPLSYDRANNATPLPFPSHLSLSLFLWA
jgi:hypothetical protein